MTTLENRTLRNLKTLERRQTLPAFTFVAKYQITLFCHFSSWLDDRNNTWAGTPPNLKTRAETSTLTTNLVGCFLICRDSWCLKHGVRRMVRRVGGGRREVNSSFSNSLLRSSKKKHNSVQISSWRDPHFSVTGHMYMQMEMVLRRWSLKCSKPRNV